MIKSLSKLNQLLEPGEEYVWHAPLQPGSPGLGKQDALWPFLLRAFFIIVYLMFWPILFALGWTTAIAVTSAFVFACMSMVVPSQLIVVTNKRVIQLDSRLEVIGSYPVRDFKFGSKRGSGTVLSARGTDGTTMHWLCKANAHHISHLKKTGRNLLSS